MRLSYHPHVQRDVNEILDHYREVSGESLACRFFEDLQSCLKELLRQPTAFPFYLGHPHARRMKMRDFPYLIVYRILPDRVRVNVIKHEKRHPRYGMGRA